LEAYLTEIDEATDHVKFNQDNLALRNELLPWIELLEHWLWMARFSLDILRGLQSGKEIAAEVRRVREYREAIARHPKVTACQALLPLADLALHEASRDLTNNQTRKRTSLLTRIIRETMHRVGKGSSPDNYWRQS
jgi:hypothetical protein